MGEAGDSTPTGSESKSLGERVKATVTRRDFLIGAGAGAATAAVKAVIEALLEAEVTAKLGREKGAVRHISGQLREVDWACGQCGCADAQHFTRDGHYRRSEASGLGQH